MAASIRFDDSCVCSPAAAAMPTVAADEVWETVIAWRGQRSVLAPVHCLVVPNYDAGTRAQLFIRTGRMQPIFLFVHLITTRQQWPHDANIWPCTSNGGQTALIARFTYHNC